MCIKFNSLRWRRIVNEHVQAKQVRNTFLDVLIKEDAESTRSSDRSALNVAGHHPETDNCHKTHTSTADIKTTCRGDDIIKERRPVIPTADISGIRPYFMSVVSRL
jgi:hypothetical protein